MFKVLVADNDQATRHVIQSLLADNYDVEGFDEAYDGIQLMDKIDAISPDIIFLDVQIPGYSEQQLTEKIAPKTAVVFVTAFDQYAIEAFRINATDYVLKPFHKSRLLEAFDRAKTKVLSHIEYDQTRLEALLYLARNKQHRTHKTRLIVKELGRIKLIDVDQINFISGAGNYAELHLFDGKVVLHRETLCCLEEQLDPKIFTRIHRSSIVRHTSIQELRPNDKGDYCVLLKTGDALILSRRNKNKLTRLLN
jgi:two-component system LytT family response regulator